VVRALRAGASDYVSHGRPERLREVVVRALTREGATTTDGAAKAARLQAMGELAGGITHDLNNLLAIAGTFVDIGLESVAPGDPLVSDLTEARDALERASVLTRRVLSFLRRDREPARPVDLNELIEGLAGLLRCALGSRIALSLSLDSHLEAVHGDAAELEQVVLNLVLNARDAIGERGTVRIRTSTLHNNARRTMSDAIGRRVVLAVEDDGQGMDPDTLARIFDPFFTTKPKGTGLGLSNTRRIVTRHRGVVRVRSEVGVGTLFEVHLPTTSASKARLRPTEARRARGG
jgi:signal transduction histidine kinase